MRAGACGARRPLSAVLALAALLLGLPASAAPAAEEMHGADAVFAGRGVAIVWTVVRGGDEATTVVVVTVVATDTGVGAFAVDGVDPFTRHRVRIAGPAALARPGAVRIARSRFADHPRTEIHLGASVDALTARGPDVTVYFTGVPDTTPEVTSERALEEYVAGALSRARRR